MNVKLAEQVKQKVLKDYRHLYMGDWIRKITKSFIKGREEDIQAFQTDKSESLKVMACGTAGCIAGHTVLLAFKPSAVDLIDNVEDVAKNMLELSEEEATALFFFHSNSNNPYEHIYKEEREELKKFKPGTKGYAKVVAKAIDKCIARNPN